MGSSVYFISDTHLGDGSPADKFLHPRAFLDLLDRIEAEPGAELVLLGDILELWSCSLDGILVQYAPIVQAIIRLAATHPVTYVAGNHDCLPLYHYLGAALGALRIAERYEAGRGALIALHGHQFDPMNRVSTEGGKLDVPWTRRLMQAVGLLQRLGGEPAARVVDKATDLLTEATGKIDHLLPHWDDESRGQQAAGLKRTGDVLGRESPGMRGYPEGEERYGQAAVDLMRRGARFVLMGHTHHPLRRTYGSRAYVNTGSWVWDRYPPTYGLWQKGRLTLHNALDHSEWNV